MDEVQKPSNSEKETEVVADEVTEEGGTRSHCCHHIMQNVVNGTWIQNVMSHRLRKNGKTASQILCIKERRLVRTGYVRRAKEYFVNRRKN
jgi:hypothetical protein